MKFLNWILLKLNFINKEKKCNIFIPSNLKSKMTKFNIIFIVKIQKNLKKVLKKILKIKVLQKKKPLKLIYTKKFKHLQIVFNFKWNIQIKLIQKKKSNLKIYKFVNLFL